MELIAPTEENASAYAVSEASQKASVHVANSTIFIVFSQSHVKLQTANEEGRKSETA